MSEVVFSDSETLGLEQVIGAAKSAPAFAGMHALLDGVLAGASLDSLPFTTKEAFRGDFHAYLTGERVTRLHCTSGSTGRPAFVVYSQEEIESITRRAVRTMRLAGVQPEYTVLNLFGYGTFIAGNLYDWGATRLGTCVVPFGSASMTPPSFGEEAIRSLAPEVLNGVPSYLARYLGSLRARGVANVDRVRIVQCAGEVLTPSLRSRLESVLAPGTEVFDQYGMTEFGPLAAECGEHDGLHLLDDGLVFEVIDDDGRRVTRGAGELVVTSARNRAMALLRYRTGDRVELVPEPCACGDPSPRVRVKHRTGDLTKVRGVLCSKQDMIDSVRAVEGVDQFKIELVRDADEVDRVVVTLTQAPGAETDGASTSAGADATREALERRLRDAFSGRVRFKPDQVQIVEALEVPRTVSGKPRHLLDSRFPDASPDDERQGQRRDPSPDNSEG